MLLFRQLNSDDRELGFEKVLSKINKSTITDLEMTIMTSFLDTKVYVVQEDDKIIATATLALCNTFGGLIGLIEDVAVADEYEGNGIGTELMEYVLDQAKNYGCKKIILTCKDENVPFYSNLGMETYQNCMCIKYK